MRGKTNVKALKKDIVFQAELCGRLFTFHSTWGLFNPKSIDEGTALLLKHVAPERDHAILDVGCGYGAIGLVLASQAPRGMVHMVDKDYIAVEYARKNAKLNNISNCTVYLSNGLSEVPPDAHFDCIVSNLPAKVGNELLSIILHDAHTYLKPGGTLYVVTISGLKDYIKRNFKEVFGNYEKIKQSKTYIVSKAIKQ